MTKNNIAVLDVEPLANFKQTFYFQDTGIYELVNRLIVVHTKPFLEDLLGIKAGTFRQHKLFVTSNGENGQQMPKKHHADIKKKYKEYLRVEYIKLGKRIY